MALFGSERLLRLYPKLMAAFLIVIIPVFTISLIINQYGERSVKQEIANSMLSRTEFYAELLELEFNRIIQMQRDMINDRNLQRITGLTDILGSIEWRDSVNALQSKLIQMRNSSGYITRISIYLPSEQRMISSDQLFSSLPQEEYDALLTVSKFQDQPFVRWNGKLYISFPYSDLALINEEQPTFLVSAEINEQAVSKVLSKLYVNNKGSAFVVGSRGQWYTSGSGSTSLPEGLTIDELLSALPSRDWIDRTQTLELNKNSYLAVIQNSKLTAFDLIMLMPVSEIVRPLQLYRYLFWFLLALSILMVALFSYWINMQIHRPMHLLVKSFLKVESGNLDIYLESRRSDEFGYLYKQFNHMISRIKHLIHEVYEQKFRANLAELRQLQSQINPHFMYNTYFLLYHMIRSGETEGSTQLARYLGEYFQYMFKSNQDEVMLTEELKFIQTYLNIQIFRFEDRVRVIVKPLPDSAKHFFVPKLILQPIVENAYVHGFKNMLSDGELQLSFLIIGDQLRITVEDNGEGMTEGSVYTLNNGFTDDVVSEFSALKNVYRRLKLKYGDNGELYVTNRPEGGLKVELLIPLKT